MCCLPARPRLVATGAHSRRTRKCALGLVGLNACRWSRLPPPLHFTADMCLAWLGRCWTPGGMESHRNCITFGAPDRRAAAVLRGPTVYTFSGLESERASLGLYLGFTAVAHIVLNYNVFMVLHFALYICTSFLFFSSTRQVDYFFYCGSRRKLWLEFGVAVKPHGGRVEVWRWELSNQRAAKCVCFRRTLPALPENGPAFVSSWLERLASVTGNNLIS